MQDASAQFLWRGSNSVDRADDIVHQLVNAEWETIGKFSFRQRPKAFIRIEFRDIGGKVRHMETRMAMKELRQGFTVMRGGIVQQDDDRAPEVPQQFTEKPAHFFLADGGEVKQIVEVQAPSLGAGRDSGDDRDFVPASLTMASEGSAALGCPGPGQQRSQEKARFVGED